MTQENFDRAIRATKVGLHVFPWRVVLKDGKEAKVPYTVNGHLAATLDHEQIATWFLSEFAGPEAQIGVHAGASGIVAADLDRKNGKDGFESTDGWLSFTPTWEQETPTGGAHRVYAAPDGIHLAPAGNYQGFDGLDVRAGSSWIGLYAEPPASRDEFSSAPEWLLDEKPARELGASYDGQLPEWAELVDAEAEPSNKVLDLIQRFPESDFSHSEMVEIQYNAIRLGSEGQPGVSHALQLLRDIWLARDPGLHSTPQSDWAWKFDEALVSGIRKAGALEDRIASLPRYETIMNDAQADVVNALIGFPGDNPKAEWFRAANTCIRFGYSDEQTLSLVWSGSRTKGLSRDWGIEFCAERVADARTKIEVANEAVEREVAQATRIDEARIKPDGISLLTDAERKYLVAHGNFIHRYVAHAHSRFDRANSPYHAANAWTILSLVYGPCGFVPMSGKNLGLNLFAMTLGESSTGKSDSIILRQEILRRYFANDLGYDVGTETSPEVLHEEVLMRGPKPTFFNTDEASGFFAKLAQKGAWNVGMEDKITEWYGGWVGPVNKRVSKASLGDSAKGGPCYFATSFFATPDRLFGALTQEQFLSGFLARFQWSFGFPATDDDSRHDETQPDEREERNIDGWTDELVSELQANVEHIGNRRAVKATPEGLRRLSRNRGEMERILREHSDWKITESAYRRLCDSLRKCAALLALSRGSTHIEMVDILGTIEQAEQWLSGLIEASKRVSSSAFEREAREIAYAVRTMSASNGFVSAARLRARFARYEPREYKDRLEWGTQMGLIGYQEAAGDHKDRWYWRGEDGTD